MKSYKFTYLNSVKTAHGNIKAALCWFPFPSFIAEIKIFKDIGFSIYIQTNLKEVDFLDVTLNLRYT